MESIKNKGRILALLQYLYKNTDEDHTVTTNELIEILSQAGYTANRKTIKDDINIIVEAGFDVITVKFSSNSFFFADRTFELPELKLLVDAVCSSRFISISKSEQLIQKLSTLTSSNLSSQLIQRIYTKDRIKSTNGQLYYVIDKVTRFYYNRNNCAADIAPCACFLAVYHPESDPVLCLFLHVYRSPGYFNRIVKPQRV